MDGSKNYEIVIPEYAGITKHIFRVNSILKRENK